MISLNPGSNSSNTTTTTNGPFVASSYCDYKTKGYDECGKDDMDIPRSIVLLTAGNSDHLHSQDRRPGWEVVRGRVADLKPLRPKRQLTATKRTSFCNQTQDLSESSVDYVPLQPIRRKTTQETIAATSSSASLEELVVQQQQSNDPLLAANHQTTSFLGDTLPCIPLRQTSHEAMISSQQDDRTTTESAIDVGFAKLNLGETNTSPMLRQRKDSCSPVPPSA